MKTGTSGRRRWCRRHRLLRAAATAVLCAQVSCSPEPPLAQPMVNAAATEAIAQMTPEAAQPLLLEPPARSADTLASYHIDQRIDDAAASLTGELALRYPNRTGKALTSVPLVLYANAARELGAGDESAQLEITAVYQSIVPAGTASQAARKTAVTFTSKRPTLVEVRLAEPVSAGQDLRLVVDYRATLRRLAGDANDLFSQALGAIAGMSSDQGQVDYGLLAVGDGLLTAAMAYPLIPPYQDGAFDTAPPARIGDIAYNDVLAFDVRTTVPAGVTIATNLVDAGPLRLPGDVELTRSQGNFVRDFVLVGGRDLEKKSAACGTTQINSYFRRKDARAGKRALKTAVASLKSYERRFGPYPYSELDVAEASLVGGAGGVEFSAMVLIAGMLYRDPDRSSGALSTVMSLFGLGGDPAAEPKATPADEFLGNTLDIALEFTVAHEVAHQYFAGIVGNDSRQYPTLDEPLAQYAAGLVMQDMHGPARGQRAMDMNVKLNYAVYRLAGGPDRAVLRDTRSYDNAVEYAGLVYGKAPYLYCALRDQLGAERLHQAIRRTIEQYRFQIISIDQWRDALAQHTGGADSPVLASFERWLGQRHGDVDLGIGDPGKWVFDAMLPPHMSKAVRDGFDLLGIKPEALLKDLLGSAAGHQH